jgi:tetratricopeptide (TPR) repeat protein
VTPPDERKEKKKMDRSVLGFMIITALVGAPALTKAQEAQALSEPQLLSSAADALKTGDTEGAVQLYQSAIIYSPGDPVPYLKLAELYVGQSQLELARQYFSLALDVQPAYAPALQGLALLDLATGDRAGALAQHEVLLRACGATCPETAQVEKALNTSTAR